MKSENHFKHSWKKVTAENTDIDPDIDFRIWANIQARISEIIKRKNIIFAAAVMVPALALSAILFFQKNLSGAKEYYSGKQPLSITLEDGSSVKMKPGSTLQTNEDFAAGSRDVRFAGEGFFEVKENKKLPFRVFGENFSTEVLGTKFTLVSTGRLKKVELKEGSIKISHNGKDRVLKPLENWTLDEAGREAVYFDKGFRTKINVGRQRFDEVVKILEDTYHYQINYPKAYKSQIITGTLEGDLPEILSIMGYPFHLEPAEHVKEKEITLK